VAFLALSPLAGAAEVTASVDSKEVAVGVPFMIGVRAEGTSLGSVKLPENVKGLQISPEPVRKYSNFSLRPGSVSGSVEYGFMATASEPGRVTVPPIGVMVNGKMAFSNPIELTVTPGAPQIAPPRGPRHSPEREEVSLEDAVFVRSEVDKPEVFEQEPVRLTLSLWYIDNDALDVESYERALKWPATEGFYATPRQPSLSPDNTGEFDGRRYRVLRFRQTLYPARAGDLTVGEWGWYGNVRFLTRMGLQGRDLTLQTKPVTVRVKPLPQPRPADFHGAVGHFEVRADLSETRVAQGMPTKLIVRVMGEGNPDAIGDPVLPAIAGAHVNEPERQDVPIQDPQGISVEKSFVYTLTPTQAGTLHIPELTYTYFDTVDKAYSTKKLGPFDVEVVPSGESARRVVVDASSPGAAESTPEPGELAPLVLDPGQLEQDRSWGAVAAVMGLVPPLAYAALAVVMARRRRFQTDVRYARSYRARTRALRRLDTAPKAGEPSDELFHALTGFVADKCTVSEAGMTSADVSRLLEANAVPDEVREGYLKILKACERARYGASELSSEELEALIHAAHANVDALDSEWRRNGR
jgi:hypothetical protein